MPGRKAIEGRQGKEVFFFEKKKQKTFINGDCAKCPDAWGWMIEPYSQKFFASFFQKRRLPCLPGVTNPPRRPNE